MCDLSSVPPGDLRARLHDGIARRLAAETPAERARAGDDLLAVLHELRRRDGARPGEDGTGPHPDGDVRTVPAPLRGGRHRAPDDVSRSARLLSNRLMAEAMAMCMSRYW